MIKTLPQWTEGVESSLKKNNAELPEKYSWYARDENGRTVFITEADHENKDSSIVKLKEGYIQRNINPLGKDLHTTSKRHAKEVFLLAKHAYEKGDYVKVLLTRNSRYSKTPNKPTKAMLKPTERFF